jgi:hypothetical protein
MNDELIFVKTAVGEDAVRDRTRLVQRNLRMVLILVDGLTNVGVLKEKAGDPVMIETALAELERIGLIESIQTRGTRQATTVAEALTIAAAPSSPEPETYGDFPTVDTVFDGHIAAARERIGADIVPSVEDAPFQRLPDAQHRSKSSRGWFSEMLQRWSQMREERAYERAYGKPGDSDAKALTEDSPFPRKRKPKLKTIVTLALSGFLVVGAARIVFYPYDEYRPVFEARLGKMLAADEVKIGNVRLAFTPLPLLVMDHVVIGSGSDAIADSISMSPDPGLLFGGRTFREVRIAGLAVREPFIGRMSQWFPAESMEGLPLEKMDVDGLSIDLGWTVLRGLSGAVSIVPHGGGAAFIGKAGQGALQFEVSPLAHGVHISAKSAQWTIPISPPLTVAALDFSGTLSPGLLTIGKVDARAFDGLVGGTGSLAWQSSPKLKLDFALKHLDAAKLLEALQAPALLAGELAGQAQLVAEIPSTEWLNKGTKLEGSVAIARGSIKRIDLAGALKVAGNDNNNASRRGGDTGFEDLASKVSVDSGSVRLSSVRLSSGLMLASGQAAISRQTGAISGMASVELRGTTNARRAMVSMSGSARDPDSKVVR